MSKELRDAIVRYAQSQVDLSWAGSMPLSEMLIVEKYAEDDRIALQKIFNKIHNSKIRLPKVVNK